MIDFRNATITLQDVTKENLSQILKLEVSETQRKFVAPNSVSIAQAYFYQEGWFQAIYADETPIGFVMLYIDEEKTEYDLWRFMIDQRYQGQGLGMKALKLVIDIAADLPDAEVLHLSYVPETGNPAPFYAKAGFEETGKVEHNENVMRLVLHPHDHHDHDHDHTDEHDHQH